MNAILLTPYDLGLAALLILLLAAVIAHLQFGLSRSLLIAAARLTIQLLLVGLVLKVVFAQSNLLFISLIALFMLLAASREIVARQKRKFAGWWSYGVGAFAMFTSSFAVTLFALLLVIGPTPWYAPQYAIPLLGMILGNTMTGISIGVDRLLQTAWEQRGVIEQRLMLGESCQDALRDISRDSFRGGMIPVINAMATAGIISLPGMMTGQILAGSPPFEAVKYQILIWLLIAAGSGFGMLTAITLSGKRIFDQRERLRLDRLRKNK